MTIEQINKESAEKIAKDFPIKKQERTPRQYDSIRNGALNLSLKERVQLKAELTKSIVDEVESKKKEAEEAEKISKE